MNRDEILTVRISKNLKLAAKESAYQLRMSLPEYVNHILTVATGIKKTTTKFYRIKK